MMRSRRRSDVPAIPSHPAPRIPALDLLIEHEREVCKLSEAKRERSDAVSLALITAATALGAVLVTAARSLPENHVPKAAAWIVLGTLGLTIVTAVITRATFILLRVPGNRDRGTLRAKRDTAKTTVSARAQSNAVDVNDEAAMAELQKAVLAVWVTRTEVNEYTVHRKHYGFAVSSALVLIAVGMLGWIAISVLLNVW